MCLFHKWEYLASNPPLLSFIGLHEGQLDIMKCHKCGKFKRTLLESFPDSERVYIDDEGYLIKYQNHSSRRN